MAKAVANPAELRRFAQQLKRFNVELQSNMQSVQARMGTLSQSWRDQEQAKFEEEFDATIKTLHRFIKASDVHIPFLLRKAQRIEEYLQQR
ncbi:MAG: WXG100 family type VII secretion target [Phycisphaerales bacterium]